MFLLTGCAPWVLGFLLAVAFSEVKGQRSVNQTTLDHLAETLDVSYTVVTNTKQISNLNVTITLTNTGQLPLEYAEWTVYLFSIFRIEPSVLTRPGITFVIPGHGLAVEQVNGMLFTMKPTSDFKTMQPGDVRVLRLRIANWQVSKSDIFPNWYMVGSAGTEARIITSTAGDNADFVTPPQYPHQQKRYEHDLYGARIPQERYNRNFVPYADPDSEVRVIPRPWQLTLDPNKKVKLWSAWKVVDTTTGRNLTNEVNFIVDKLSRFSITNSTASSPPTTNVIVLRTGNIVIADNDVIHDDPDAYSVMVDDVENIINISGEGSSGVFLGVQTVLSLLMQDGTVPKVTVYDAPRFRYRGLHLDVSRNFHSFKELLRLLEVMAMYKLNRLHLHLADDEGWRLEIAGLPELTQVGAQRCHDPAEDRCLLPQLGSGPFTNNSGSGFLSASEYRTLLTAASKLHIQVIPEIDMPGHARAAIKAMEKRYRMYAAQGNMTEAEKYRLIDPNDTSVYTTPQIFNDNAIDVCRNSTYTFITKVVQEIKKLHEGIQPLTVFHSGLDEVGKGAWENSTICRALFLHDAFARQSPKQYFFKRVAEIVHAEGLNLGGWEDGLMLQGNTPFNRSLAPNPEVIATVWDNVWDWGTSSRTYTLANMGYKVVMAHATSLYFDHPYEPAWEERGYYWASRFTDSQDVFSFMPDDYYANIDIRISGHPISREEVCGKNDVNCPALEKPKNIIGIQGQLWSETVRTQDQTDSMLFPRILALAERAWHHASWEKERNVTLREAAKMEDWYSFARAVGYRELPRLDAMGIKYRIPPPGAVVKRQKLLVATGYPGIVVECSQDSGRTWHVADGTERIKDSDHLLLRSRTASGRYSRSVELSPVPAPPVTSQPLLDYMGDNLVVTFEVVDNYETYGTDFYQVAITLNNTGDEPVTAGNWELHFPSVQWVEPDPVLEEREFILQDQKMALSHFHGYQFKLAPLYDFPTLTPGEAREIKFKCEYWSVSKYEQFPNYFVVADGANARVIKNTMGESMSFVKDFTRPNQWKRDSNDKFDPFTPTTRYDKQSDVNDLGSAPLPYLPTPLNFQIDRSKSLNIAAGWSIVAPGEWRDVAEFLKEHFIGLSLTIRDTAPASRYIQLQATTQGVPQSDIPGAYTLLVSPEQENVLISAANATGALYGVQSIINLALQSGNGTSLPKLNVSDAPRFPFRGLYVDVARNFQSKDSILKMVRAMGVLKLNRLHLHLGDDEGWRLDIPGLPELTTMASKRCYDPTEEECLVPVMGAGPYPQNAGTGFYTIQEYQEILAAAARRHIQVIPEFDMPGHSRAAIKAMALRRRIKLEHGDVAGAHEYELDEVGDPSVYSSVQLYHDDGINPCLESTYKFIQHVMTEVKKIHQAINPLKTYHFGGDEVAHGAWVDSKACSHYVQQGTDLKALFSTRVADIAAKLGLGLAAWEDGLLDKGEPIPRHLMNASDIYANAWNNVWEWGDAKRGYELANAGYKVVMSQATHLYFDFPYEPDPNERGFYWATRTTDTRKVFLFQPQHLWLNVEITRMGDPITLASVCGDNNKGCPALQHPDNVIGMQGHIWAETVRSGEQMEYMLFPRMLALTERAWHTAQWEGQGGGAKQAKTADWSDFANTVGYGQLSVLDKLNVSYRVPPPGVRQNGGQLKVNTEFPGLTTQYRMEGSQTWRDVQNKQIAVSNGQTVQVTTLSADKARRSVPVTVTAMQGSTNTPPVASGATGISLTHTALTMALTFCILLIHFVKMSPC